MPSREPGLPIEQFIQALTSQLDRAQHAMALKARAGLPLTFAVRDLSLDLRAHVDMAGSVVRIRPAGPGEGDASNIHLELTTVTRPMIEENTFALEADEDDPSLEEVFEDRLTEEERRRLEWAGVHTVRQLLDVRRSGGDRQLQRLMDVPAERLRAAIESAARPRIRRVESVDGRFRPIRPEAPPTRPVGEGGPPRPEREGPTEPPPMEGHETPSLREQVLAPLTPRRGDTGVGPARDPDASRLRTALRPDSPAVRGPVRTDAPVAGDAPSPGKLRIRGSNLVGEGLPRVRLDGARVKVVSAKPHEIVVDTVNRPLSGVLEVQPHPDGPRVAVQLPTEERAPLPTIEAAPSNDGEAASSAAAPDPATTTPQDPVPPDHHLRGPGDPWALPSEDEP